jgi:uncharacterized membrane protein
MRILVWLLVFMLASASIAADLDLGGGRVLNASEVQSTGGVDIIGFAASTSNSLVDIVGFMTSTSNSILESNWRNTEYFDLTILDVYTNAPPASGYTTNLDMIYAYYANQQVKNDKQLMLRNIRGFPMITYDVYPTNLASISQNGYVTHIADGVVTTSVSTASFGRTNELYLPTRASLSNSYYLGATDSIRRGVENNVNLYVTNATFRVFSTYDLTNKIFIRSTNCWFRPAPACWTAWRSDYGSWRAGGVLITTKHIVTATHLGPAAVGTQFIWVRADNTYATNYVVARSDIGYDTTIMRLSNEVTGIAVAKLLTNIVSILPNGNKYVPIGLGEAHLGNPVLQLALGNSTASSMSVVENTSWFSGWRQSVDPIYAQYFDHVPYSGDSSQPLLMSTGTDIVLIGQFWTAGGGASSSAMATLFQSRINDWGDTNVLTYIDNTLWENY